MAQSLRKLRMKILFYFLAVVKATETTTYSTVGLTYSSEAQVTREIINSITFGFYSDTNFGSPLTSAFLGEEIYARVETNPTVENLLIRLNTCYATATENPGAFSFNAKFQTW